MWQKLQTFITVVEQAGFSKAAKKLGISKATVTRYVQELECEYGCPLLTRTTRHLGLTAQGEAFYDKAIEMLEMNSQLQEQLNKKKQVISGIVKIGLPTSILFDFVHTQLLSLLKAYPDLVVEIVQGNHLQDLLSSRFDVAVHCGPLPDTNLHATKIGDWQKMLVASPGYLKEFGEPKSIEDLNKHFCLDHADNHSQCWSLKVGKQQKQVAISSDVRIDSSIGLTVAAINDLGVAYLPSFTVRRSLEEGDLVPILEKHWPEPYEMFAVYSERKSQSKKIELTVGHLQAMYE